MSTDEHVPEWSYDAEARAGYLRLRRGDVKSSHPAGERIVVDSAGHGETLGIEVLSSVDAVLIDDWLARVRRDAWDACYRQMVTAPARGVIVTEKSNPYAPERRVAP